MSINYSFYVVYFHCFTIPLQDFLHRHLDDDCGCWEPVRHWFSFLIFQLLLPHISTSIVAVPLIKMFAAIFLLHCDKKRGIGMYNYDDNNNSHWQIKILVKFYKEVIHSEKITGTDVSPIFNCSFIYFS